MSTTLILRALTKRYADTSVFTNVNLDVAAGEFVAIVGESGVGKSTLLNCMAGLDAWDSGSVVLEGENVGALSDDARALLRRHKVGFVFQAFHVLPHLDVAQNVALPLLLLGTPDDARYRWMVGRRLKNLGMSELAEKHFQRAIELGGPAVR